MGLMGALQVAGDALVDALVGLPGAAELATLTPPGGGTPVAHVPVVVRHVNPVVPLGRAGAQRTGVVVLISRKDHPAKPAAGTTVATATRTYVLREIAPGALWWRGEATRG